MQQAESSSSGGGSKGWRGACLPFPQRRPSSESPSHSPAESDAADGGGSGAVVLRTSYGGMIPRFPRDSEHTR